MTIYSNVLSLIEKRIAKEAKRKTENIYRRIAEKVVKSAESNPQIREFQAKFARIAQSEDVTESETQAPAPVVPKQSKKLDPLQKAAAEFAAKKQKLEEERKRKEEEREQALRKAKQRKREKYAENQKLSQRTSKGQPIMNHIVQHLLRKIQKQDEQQQQQQSSS